MSNQLDKDLLIKPTGIKSLDFIERELENTGGALRGIKFALTYSALETGPAQEFFDKACNRGEAALRRLLGAYWGVSNQKRNIKQIAWGLEIHKEPKDPERAAHFHVYLEFNEKLERRGHDWKHTFDIKLPGSDRVYMADIDSHKTLKEWSTWVGYCCKDEMFVASTYLNPHIKTYSRNKQWTEFMDSVYRTAELEGPDAALDKLRKENESYFFRIRSKLKPELEELHRAYALNNPKLYMPYKEEDFNWPQCLIDFRVALEGWDKNLMNLPSMVFLGPSNTGKSAALRFLLRKYILRGEVLLMNSLEGLEGFRHGKHRLILMEDPVFSHGGSLRVTTDVLEALISVDQQRDMRVMYKFIQKPVNIPVVITGNPDKMPVELGGTDDITGILTRPKKKRDTEEDPAETAPEPRVDLEDVQFEIEAGIHKFDKNIPASIIKRRFIFYITQPVLKPEAAAHYSRQKEALMNPLQENNKKRYDLEAHMEKLPDMKRLLSTEVVKDLKDKVVKPVRKCPYPPRNIWRDAEAGKFFE